MILVLLVTHRNTICTQNIIRSINDAWHYTQRMLCACPLYTNHAFRPIRKIACSVDFELIMEDTYFDWLSNSSHY